MFLCVCVFFSGQIVLNFAVLNHQDDAISLHLSNACEESCCLIMAASQPV